MLNSRYFNSTFFLISFSAHRGLVETTLNFFNIKGSKANEPPEYYRKFFRKYRS